MRIRPIRDCVKNTKVNPLEKSPRGKKTIRKPPTHSPKEERVSVSDETLVKSPRSRTGKAVPQKYDLTRPPISPRRPKPSLVIRKPKRAINLCNLYERAKEPSITSILEDVDEAIDEIDSIKEPVPFTEKNVAFSCVSMKTEIETKDDPDLPPPPVINRVWKKATVANGYKLFCPDSPAKAAYSPHLLSVKLCFMRGPDDSSASSFDSSMDSTKSFELPKREFKSKRSLIR